MPWPATGRKPWTPVVTTTIPSRWISRVWCAAWRRFWKPGTAARRPVMSCLQAWPQPGSPKERSAMLTNTKPLLLVDDDLTNQDLLSRRLKRAGYATKVAGSGYEALDVLARQHDARPERHRAAAPAPASVLTRASSHHHGYGLGRKRTGGGGAQLRGQRLHFQAGRLSRGAGPH